MNASHSRPPELWRWDATDLAAAIRDHHISCVEVAAACLDRHDEVNGHLNAVVEIDREQVLADAAAADAAVTSGVPLGPLHGVPVTTKITDDQVGHATSWGVVAYRDRLATADSPAVANLRAAGAMMLGRTNSPPFAYSWWTENDLYGRTFNPWSVDHTPGGSSGGAAASVAAGITPLAHGSDTMGSIRYPAYCTGVVGLRTSFGRIPIYRHTDRSERPLSSQLMEAQGPITRTVRDARLAMRVMSTGDHRDPWWVPAPMDCSVRPGSSRIVVSVDPAGVGVHPTVQAAVERAAHALEHAGHHVDYQDPPGFREVATLNELITGHELAHFHRAAFERDGDDRLRRAYRRMTETTSTTSLPQYMEALSERTTWIRRWNEYLGSDTVLLCPTAFDPPLPHDLTTLAPQANARISESMMPARVIPLLGLPALAIPTGISDGLPTGVQLVAARFREALVLDVGQAIEDFLGLVTPVDPQWNRSAASQS